VEPMGSIGVEMALSPFHQGGLFHFSMTRDHCDS
jgi:hypothetical protein